MMGGGLRTGVVGMAAGLRDASEDVGSVIPVQNDDGMGNSCYECENKDNLE